MGCCDSKGKLTQDQMEKIVKIQSFTRAKIARKETAGLKEE